MLQNLLVVAAYVAVAFILFQLMPQHKIKKNVKEQNKKKSKLLRFQRGNKTLTPEQQKELDRVNHSNHATLKQMWQDEHL